MREGQASASEVWAEKGRRKLGHYLDESQF